MKHVLCSREHNDASCIFPVPAVELVTHRPPMLLVNCLMSRDEKQGIVEATVPESGPMITGRGILPEYLVEILAQSMAVIDGYDSVQAGRQPTGGFLVGLNRFAWSDFPLPGQCLYVTLAKSFEFGPMIIMNGSVMAEDTLMAGGELKVWIPEQ